MKKFSFICGLFALLSVSIRAQSFYPSIVYGPTNATYTTNSGSGVVIGTAKISGQSVSERVQHTGLASTTNMPTIFQISLDNVNWSSVQTNNPSSTNASTIDAFPVSTPNFTVYGRTVVQNTTTNVQGVGADVVLTPFIP